MSEERHGRVTYVIGPDGSPLTIADLPPPGTKRWVIRRKAEVVAARERDRRPDVGRHRRLPALVEAPRAHDACGNLGLRDTDVVYLPERSGSAGKRFGIDLEEHNYVQVSV